jgi:hypothetical protein
MPQGMRSPRSSHHRYAGAAAALVMSVAACAAPGAASAPAATASAPPTAALVADEVVLLPLGSASTGVSGYLAVAPAGGAVVGRLPAGAPGPDGRVVYTVESHGALRALVATRAVGAHVEASVALPAGAWALPAIVADGAPAGVAGDGRTLILVDRDPPTGRSRFLLVPVDPFGSPRLVTLNGAFDYDAMAPDGSLLYLIGHVGAPGSGHYEVRVYDVALAALRPDAVVDKRNVGEAMAGRPLARVSDAAGDYAYTLYARTDGSLFVHALDTADAIAFCIDLPAGAQADPIAGAWTLALGAGPSSDWLYALDPVRGTLVEVDLRSDSAGRLAAIPRAAWVGGRPLVGGAAVSADGTLWVAAPDGLRVIDTTTLTQRAHLLAGVMLSAVTAQGTAVLTLGGTADLWRVTPRPGGAPTVARLP